MSIIGNIIWFVFGGFFMGLSWCFFGVLAYISIVGIPWGKACFVIGQFSFSPFGKEVVSREKLSHTKDVGTSGFGTVGNIIWFICGGFWLGIGHAISAIICFITIVGIPFGVQHLKLAKISFFPIGKTIVSKDVMKMVKPMENVVEDV